MPTPNKGETQSDFIGRCIPIVLDEGTAKDNKQAAAICYSIWKRSKKKSQAYEDALEALEDIQASLDLISKNVGNK